MDLHVDLNSLCDGTEKIFSQEHLFLFVDIFLMQIYI